MAFSSVNFNFSVSLTCSFIKTLDLGTTKEESAFTPAVETITTIGTSANQVNNVWSDRRSLTGAESLDLAASLTNSIGDTITFTKIRFLAIKNNSTTPGEVLLIGGAASNQFSTPFGDASDKVSLGPGGVLVLTSPIDGMAVTASTGDLLKIDSASATISYDIMLVGC